MKQFYLLLSCLLAVGTLSAQVYVDADATGAGDGTSWADAYTSLSDAIAAAPAGEQIWIADGTYTPPAESSFFIDKSLALVGGFNGTETMMDERDPAANVVILSGDVAGDDSPFDYNTNKTDNALHVVQVDSLITEGVIFDGLSIIRGRTQEYDEEEPDFTLYSGAGILAFSPIGVNNVSFTENYAGDGAAIDLEGAGTVGSSITNIFAEENVATHRGIVQIFATGNILVQGSTFQFNTTDRGSVYATGSVNVLIDNCTFDSNSTPGRAGGVGLISSFPVAITNSTFNNNVAANGGALYVATAAGRVRNPDELIIDNCTFSNNAAGNFGGAVLNLDYNWRITNTVFDGNTIDSGVSGGIHAQGDSLEMVFVNTTFNNNIAGFASNAQSGSGGAILLNNVGDGANDAVSVVFDSCTISNSVGLGFGGGIYAIDVELAIRNSTLTNNVVDARGGGVTAFNTNMTVENSLFEGNAANSGGGAINFEGDEGAVVSLVVDNSEFIVNTADDRTGGAINSFIGADVTINDSEFVGNTAGVGDELRSGGAIGITSSVLFGDGMGGTFTVSWPASLTINRSIFSQNAATGQAGAINTSNTTTAITNSLFENNNVLVADPAPDGLQGAGGAISFNFIDDATTVDMVNNTFYNNGGRIGQDISTFHVDSTGMLTSTMTLTNNAFVNELGTSYEPEPGDETSLNVVSGGGNYVYQDTSLTAYAVASDIIEDETEISDIFTDADEGNFEPTAMSPLVNSGVNVEGLTVDLNDHNRVGGIDIGAIEYRNTILDIVVASDVHNTLESLVVAAGLAETLDGNGPFTVFAPVDAAFAALDPDLVAAVSSDPDLLRTVLLYHVVAGAVPSSALTDGQVVPTVQGETITIELDGGNVFIRTAASQTDLAQVTTPDVPADNGIIHIIDAVLLPPTVGTEDITESGLDISLYPNPVSDLLRVNVTDPGVKQVDLRLFDLQGRLVRNMSLSSGTHDVDVRRLPAGNYFLELVVDKSQTYRAQIVKQ